MIVVVTFFATQLYGRNVFDGMLITVVRVSIAIGYWYYLKKYIINTHIRNQKRRYTISAKSLILPLLALFPALAQISLNVIFYYYLDQALFGLTPDLSRAGISKLPFNIQAHSPFEYFQYSMLLWWTFFVLWGAFHVFISYWLPYHYRSPLYLQTPLIAKQTELSRLDTQINSDFLFDALHSLVSEADHDPERVKQITLNLANYLRFSLDQEEKNTLKKELEAVHCLLKIETIRHENAFQYSVETDDETQDIETPIPVILPLIDYLYNSLSSPIPEHPIQLRIQIARKDKWLVITVTNSVSHNEISLNTLIPLELETFARKLQLIYSNNNHLQFFKHSFEQITVRLEIPIMTARQRA